MLSSYTVSSMEATDKAPLRVWVDKKDRDEVRVLAARSGLPMSQWCERVVREAIEDERVFKMEKE